MKTITVTELRGNIYNLLDEVLKTGIPLEINKGGKNPDPGSRTRRFHRFRLIARPDVIKGNPDDLVDIHWEKELNLDLP